MGRGKSEHNKQLVEAAYNILSEIQPASIRAVCYRLFADGLVDSMSKNNTNRVSRQLVEAREHGQIPWDWVVDESREPERQGVWTSPAEFAEAAKHSFRRDAWQHQGKRIEVWSEKGTVRGTLAPVLQEYGVTLQVFHGYGSATVVKGAAIDSVSDPRPLKVFYVGDWDPSGLHMSEVDLQERLIRYGGAVNLIRLALTEEDIGPQLKSFEVNSKRSDPRWRWYRQLSVNKHGPYCWELDALSPVVLRKRLENAIKAEIEPEAWERTRRCEEAEQKSLAVFLDHWQSFSIPMPACE
ncbi:MAG: hypothetical protein AB1898_09520 [Acidobacteriota bacterium]